MKEPKIKSFRQAIQVIDDLHDFAISRDHTDLLDAIASVAAKLEKHKLANMRQNTILSYFMI